MRNGRSEFQYCLAGLDPNAVGSLFRDDRPHGLPYFVDLITGDLPIVDGGCHALVLDDAVIHVGKPIFQDLDEILNDGSIPLRGRPDGRPLVTS